MSDEKKYALHRMAERMAQILEQESVTRTPDGDDERRPPPLIHIDPDFGRSYDSAHTELLWVGLRMVKVPHFDDESIQAELEASVDDRSHLEIVNRLDRECDLQIADERAGPGTVVELTETLIAELYDAKVDDIIKIEWDDIEAGERLTAEEFLKAYDTE